MDNVLLTRETFSAISLEDPFFDSLKSDYPAFSDWYTKDGTRRAFTFRNMQGLLDGFLYLKVEEGTVEDVEPPLPPASRLKIGTFKINPHGTRLGERFMKRAFDLAIAKEVKAIYVTVFPKHGALLELLERYGFAHVGAKPSRGDAELVLERRLDVVTRDVVRDYPRIPITKDRHFVLSLHPQWHSRLLPDSLLQNESASILKDVSATNSIHKVYLAAMRGVEQLRRGDTLLIYRTAQGGPAYHTSVITSLCVVEELRNINDFQTVEAFLAYCAPYSIFTETELRQFFKQRKYPWIIRFTYNLALTKRPNRKALIEQAGLDPDMYWGFFQISEPQLKSTLKLSTDYEKARTLVYSS